MPSRSSSDRPELRAIPLLVLLAAVAGCGGGSIIDFWMKWKQLKFGEAVHELRVMLEV